MIEKGLMPPPYRGGKSIRRRDGVGEWVANQLPAAEWQQQYIEPFCGMGGVLLQRPKVRREIVNDLDDLIYCYWLALRDHSDEFRRVLLLTPFCEQEMNECYRRLNDPAERATMSVVEVARCFLTVSTLSFRHNYDHSLKPTMNFPPLQNLKSPSKYLRQTAAHITSEAFLERIRDVNVWKQDAVFVLRRYAEKPNAVIYCDPPYSQGSEGYGAQVDNAAFTQALKDVPEGGARVAVSGYEADGWDCLGWRKTSKPSFNQSWQGEDLPRTECLWMNYLPQVGGSLF